MVLIRKTAACLFLTFSRALLFSQEENYAVSTIKKILADSPQGIILENNIESLEITIEQQKKFWLPTIQFDFTSDSKLLNGDYNYIRNGGIISGSQLILNPSTAITISQNLPGNGRFSMNAGYGISYLTGHNAYMQQLIFSWPFPNSFLMEPLDLQKILQYSSLKIKCFYLNLKTKRQCLILQRLL